MLYSDINELKLALEIDPSDTQEDKALNFFLKMASGWIETYLNRPGLIKAERTEYLCGSGSQKLLVLHRPVFPLPVPRVWVDEYGKFGDTVGSFPSEKELTYGESFSIWRDREDGRSERGIFVRHGDYWPRPAVRQRGILMPFIGEALGNIKLIYTAGYTADTLPTDIVLACVQLVARLRHLFPLGVPLNSEGYEDRSISVAMMGADKSYLLAQVKHLLLPHRNVRI